MRKPLLFVLLSFVAIINEIQAQEKKGVKKYFSSQISTGILEGEQNTSFHVELLNGVHYKTWFAGIGTGLDYYYYRTLPVYLSGIKYLSPKNHSFFVQGDVGMNFVWEDERITAWNEVSHQFKPGLYWNGIVGFATGLDRKNAFSFGVGYSYKSFEEIKEIAVWCFNPPCESSFERYKYNLNRLTLRLGWQFNYSR
ncbi:MAG TPA: hypothetical protein VF144_07860 [Chitinophagaceae bacterium]